MKRLLLSLTALMAITSAVAQNKDNSGSAVARQLDIFNAVYKELNSFYVDTLDAQKTIGTALQALFEQLDPYTDYIPAEEQSDFMMISTGQYGGIGSYIQQRLRGNTGVYISGPYKNSPAARAGLRSGDRIVAIDGVSTKGWTSDSVSRHLKGQANTRVTIDVVRPYVEDSLLQFTITRENINVTPVPYYGVVNGSLGYIALSTFNEHSAAKVREAVLELRKNPAVRGLVLDLRGNGGGVMEGAVQIVGLFVPKGTTVVTTRGREKASEKIYKTTQPPIDTDIPLAVLIDGGSASASEITAGALQDLDRAVIIGTRSYGKGLVQSTRPLPYDGLLKLTVSKYYIPSGRLIQEVDYSQRNDDGTYQRTVADTLGNVFYTAHRREVRDGGGITPDIKIDYPELNRLVYNIVRDNWAFDYATRYQATHPTLPSPENFTVTDSIFNDFKRFIDPEKFEYDKVCEIGLETLKKVAETEGYMNDSTRAEFARLETLLKHDLNRDLDLQREAISTILAQELVTRYYFNEGYTQYATRDDKALAEAAKILTDPKALKKTLGL